MTLFERYLTVWVILCIIVGVGAGQMSRVDSTKIASIKAVSIGTGGVHRVQLRATGTPSGTWHFYRNGALIGSAVGSSPVVAYTVPKGTATFTAYLSAAGAKTGLPLSTTCTVK